MQLYIVHKLSNEAHISKVLKRTQVSVILRFENFSVIAF